MFQLNTRINRACTKLHGLFNIKRGIASLGLVAALMTPAAAHADNVSVNCATVEFSLFTLIMPRVVGSCLLNPAPVTFLGNDPRQDNWEGTFIAQKTDNGGMLLECVFNGWTAYTNGQRTWIMGPFGVMTRPNNAHLPYPYDQACIPPPPPGSSDSSGGAGGGDGSGGGGGGGCHINTSVVNAASGNISAVAIASCGSNATATINITQSAAQSLSGNANNNSPSSGTPATTSGGTTNAPSTNSSNAPSNASSSGSSSPSSGQGGATTTQATK